VLATVAMAMAMATKNVQSNAIFILSGAGIVI
jgi:hypothetical protein